MKKLLVCTDGSVYATSICDHAAWLAKRLDASIHVLNMLEPAPIASFQSDFTGIIGFDAQQKLSDELVALEQAKSRVAQSHADVIIKAARAHLTESGIPDAEIEAEARHGTLVDAVADFDPTHDMIVIGKRGEHADFAKGHLGSNLERVIRISKHPVLVAARAFQPIERVLIAFDGGPSARKAIDYACRHPLFQGLSVRLLCVGSPSSAAKLELEAAQLKLHDAGHQVEVEQPNGEPEKIIPEVVSRENIQLLVMGAYGHSRIREFFIGSTTTALVRTCQIPVLLFR
ncbi:MAG: UspA domain-containing protein [Puniceicoccaceae bacterium 5H]|nr:MAG: UspA domain-containing protein [Puniceicoccaceae bacterium 5H]